MLGQRYQAPSLRAHRLPYGRASILGANFALDANLAVGPADSGPSSMVGRHRIAFCGVCKCTIAGQ